MDKKVGFGCLIGPPPDPFPHKTRCEFSETIICTVPIYICVVRVFVAYSFPPATQKSTINGPHQGTITQSYLSGLPFSTTLWVDCQSTPVFLVELFRTNLEQVPSTTRARFRPTNAIPSTLMISLPSMPLLRDIRPSTVGFERIYLPIT